MLDWLTLNCPYEKMPDIEAVIRHRNTRPQIMKVDPMTGDIEWCVPCHESIRSDSHQISIKLGSSTMQVYGSPARSMGLPHNLFGSSDIVECAEAHIRVAQQYVPFLLPGIEAWHPSRTDITYNFLLPGFSEVKQSLCWLRQSDGGRLKVNDKYAETVYWNERSQINSNKAYAKGPHLQYQSQKHQVQISPQELLLAQCILRLENKRGNKWWSNFRKTGRDWKTITETELKELHRQAFENIIGTDKIEVAEMDNILERLKEVINEKTGKRISEGQALAAYRTWGLIKMIGQEEVKAGMPKASWHRHKSILFAAGLAWADFSAGNVVPFRRKSILIGEPVESWDDIYRQLKAA